MREAIALRRGKPEDVGMAPARVDLIRERARGWVANGDTPSLVLLVARKGVIVLEEAYGILRPSDNAPLQTDSMFPLMSISKPFTAAAVLCLVEDGLLSLKHPITDYLPEITAPGADQVLIADLLSHTSGYDDDVVLAHVKARLDAQVPVPDPASGQHPHTNRVIRYAGDAPLSRPPGEAMSYFNFGYVLLSDIVRRVSARPFHEFVESRIFGPLGMKDSTFVLAPRMRSRRVLRRAEYPGTDMYLILPPIDSEEADAWDNGMGGATSTARDIAVFSQMLLNGGTYDGARVLSRASIAAMTSPQLAPATRVIWRVLDPTTGALLDFPGRGGNYGYGLAVVTADDRNAYMNGSLASPRTFAHLGAFISYFWVDPDAQVVGVYLSVMPRLLNNGTPLFTRGPHFQDMVHAAILD
jgi:CubicO group peptidase (beta-lactamase class C family)